MVVEILAGIDADRVAVGKLLEAVRQLRGRRNFAAADQDRNDGDAFLERRLDLDADLIVVLVDPGASLRGRAAPIRPHHREQDIALLQDVLNVGAEIDADGDVVDVPEHRLPAVMADQPVENAPGDGFGIGAPIRNREVSASGRHGEGSLLIVPHAQF